MSSDVTISDPVVKRNKRLVRVRICDRCGNKFHAKDKCPSERKKFFCSDDCSRDRSKQIPGQLYKFRCGHSSVLPDLGVTNELVKWMVNSKSKKNRRGGNWCCRICLRKWVKQRRDGTGTKGMINRIKNIVWRANSHARSRSYAGISATPEDLLSLWNSQNNSCAACGRSLSFATGKGCNLDHDHDTGLVRGFVCRKCNLAEGLLKDYSDEQFSNFVKYRSTHEERKREGAGSVHDTILGSQ